MARAMVAFDSPAELAAVTVYMLGAAAAAGVPLMVPLVVSNTSPAGSAGAIVQVTTAPPWRTGVIP